MLKQIFLKLKIYPWNIFRLYGYVLIEFGNESHDLEWIASYLFWSTLILEILANSSEKNKIVKIYLMPNWL